MTPSTVRQIPRVQRDGWFHRGSAAVGHFCFRYRNALFPVTFAVAVFWMRPQVMFGSARLDRALAMSGTVLALLGESVRLLTIGLDSVERNGRSGRVHASQLIQTGLFAHTRNPLYLGNLLIALGVVMVAGSPAIYLTVAPLFLCVYLSIIAAEESYLHATFGADYAAYCARVPRLWPLSRGIWRTVSGSTCHWQRAFRQDLSTIAGLLSGLILLPLWRVFWLRGWTAETAAAPLALGLEAVVLCAYGLLMIAKKYRRAFSASTDTPGSAR